jgi:hypothetical protein
MQVATTGIAAAQAGATTDVFSMLINAATNNAYLCTCFTRQALIDICERMGYAIPPQATSHGSMLFYFKDSANLNVDAVVNITRNDLAATYNSLRFEATEPITFTVPAFTFTNLGQNRLSANGRLTGEKIRLLALDAAYYVTRVDATYAKLASTPR